MRKAFSQNGFRRLYTGLTASMLGDSLMLIVLSMWVKSLTGSNGKAGMTFFWMVIPALFAPVLGMFIDRVRRKPLLVWGNVASALIVVPLLLVREASDVWIIYAVAFCYGVSFVVLPAGLNGLLKELMPEELLVDANSSLQTTKEGFRLIGPLAGAGLFATLGGGAVAVLDAVSFVVAAVVIAHIPLVEDKPQRVEQHWRAEMSEGLRYLGSERILRHTLVAVGLTLVVIGFSESAVFAITDFFDKPVEFVGVIVTVQGVGAILGGVTTSRWVHRFGEPATIAVSLVVMAGGLGLTAASEWLWLVLASAAVIGYSLPMLIISFTTLIQVRTPARLMGRVSAAVEVVMGTPQALSIAVGALLVTIFGFHVIFGIMAAVTVVAVAYLLVSLRGHLGRRAPVPGAVVVDDVEDDVLDDAVVAVSPSA
ncbi:MAG TPA: MFS transporter [Actinomycetales bacterium]|nr:MFS transporter [Actinomycetales bacterium]